MDKLEANGYELKNLGKINVILGKNGCGKSSLLKSIESFCIRETEKYGIVKYISPERGGELVYEPAIEQSISSNSNWMPNTRRKNRADNFRQQSVVQFRNLELMFYREMDSQLDLRNNPNHTFSNYINKINFLLDNIELSIDNNGSLFKICKKGSTEVLSHEQISSGESELISLAIECLVFEKECSAGKNNLLFLDEPDVHLHPDLQARLCGFLLDVVNNKSVTVILATHSTAILGALSPHNDTRVEFMARGQTELMFKKILNEYQKILPVFGAHPLSNMFNQYPILLVEGEDDERIWQQAIRSSNKKLKLYPCSTDSISKMPKYEEMVNQIISSVYDKAKAYSLRDCDEGDSLIGDYGHVIRFKLSCRAAENLLLTNEVLTVLDIEWDKLIEKINCWLEITTNRSHPHYQEMSCFKNNNYDRKNFDLKAIRNDIMHIIGKSISWEVAVGKTLGQIINGDLNYKKDDEHGIISYLGRKMFNELLKPILP